MSEIWLLKDYAFGVNDARRTNNSVMTKIYLFNFSYIAEFIRPSCVRRLRLMFPYNSVLTRQKESFE